MTPPNWQLLLSGGAIAFLGLPHGASDLAVVPMRQRPSFLLAYLGVVGLVIALWQIAPNAGLAILLILSAAHFALDVPDGTDAAAAWGWGLLLVGGPAIGHRSALIDLFTPLTGSAVAAQVMADALHLVGLAGLGLIVARWAQRRAPVTALPFAGALALLFLPPLIGFAAGFVFAHAWPQLEERQQELGCPHIATYLRQVAPILAGAGAVITGIAVAFATHPSAPAAILFAAIAALATPHMLVTPLWRKPAPCPGRAVPL